MRKLYPYPLVGRNEAHWVENECTKEMVDCEVDVEDQGRISKTFVFDESDEYKAIGNQGQKTCRKRGSSFFSIITFY